MIPFQAHTPQPIPIVDDDDDDEDDHRKPGSGDGNIDPDDDEGPDDDEEDEDEDETLWSVARGTRPLKSSEGMADLCYSSACAALCESRSFKVGLPAAPRVPSEWMSGHPIIGF